MDNDFEKKIYIIMESKYLEHMGRNGSINDNLDLYPPYWLESENYVKKANILAKAITKNIPIADVEEYKDLVEGVKFNSYTK